MWEARRAGSPWSLASHPDLPQPLCAPGSSPVTWGHAGPALWEWLWAYSRDSPVAPLVLVHRKWQLLLSRPQLLLSRPSQLLDGVGVLIFTSPPVPQFPGRVEVSFLSPSNAVAPWSPRLGDKFRWAAWGSAPALLAPLGLLCGWVA